MVCIERLIGYTIPLYGNNRHLPYGKLVVRDDKDAVTKTVDIKENDGMQYFTFKRKRYYLHNVGTLYSPDFQIIQ